MPFDLEASRLQGDISQLEKEIAAIKNAIEYERVYSAELNLDTIHTLEGIAKRLQDELGYKEMKLEVHRQKTNESGVKY